MIDLEQLILEIEAEIHRLDQLKLTSYRLGSLDTLEWVLAKLRKEWQT